MSASVARLHMSLLGLVLGGSLFACVDKAPPATWPEPPPPVMAKPVGGEAAEMTPTREPDLPSEALDGTNDPKEGAVGLDGVDAEQASPADPVSESSPTPDAKADRPSPTP